MRSDFDANKVPTQLSTVILKRFMPAADLEALFIKYKGARRELHAGPKEPTADQIKWAAELKAGAGPQELAVKYGVPDHAIYGARTRVAVWQYIKS